MDLDKEIIDLTSDSKGPSSKRTRSELWPWPSARRKSDTLRAVRNDDKVKRERAKRTRVGRKGAKNEVVQREGGKRSSGERAGGNREGGKKEGDKRAAASAIADRSGDVEVASKPTEEDEEFSRPAKRGKGPARDGGEEDVEMVGRKGVDLPHNRFSCSENLFNLTDESTHKNRCKLCYCFVCNRLATDCSEWQDHCHASDAGSKKHIWHALRIRAKPRLQRRLSPPVSGLYHRKSSTSALEAELPSPGTASPSRGAAPPSSGTEPPSSGPPPSSSGAEPLPPGTASVSSTDGSSCPEALPASETDSPNHGLPNNCNCEALCKPLHETVVHQPFEELIGKEHMPMVVYLKGLTKLEALHVEQIAVLSTIKLAARNIFGCNTDLISASSHALRISKYEEEHMPYIHKVSVRGGKFDMMVAQRDTWGDHPRAPWTSLWTPGVELSTGGVRLGGIDNLGFVLATDLRVKSVEKRKSYFDHFLSETPLPISVWLAVRDSDVDMEKEDRNLLKCIQDANRNGLIEVEVKATFDPITSAGTFSLDVILLSKLLFRGTSFEDKSNWDFATIVRRLVLEKSGSPPIGSSSSSSCSSSSSSSSSSSASSLSSSTTEQPNEKNPSFSSSLSSSSSPPSSARSTLLTNGAAVAEARVAGSAGPPSGETSTAEVTSAGKVGRTFAPSVKRHGGRASLDVTLSGLLGSLKAEQRNPRSWRGFLDTPAKLLTELENLQHNALIDQPACLTVQLYEHQLQDAQWMYDQEMLDGGTMRHLWVELPPHPLAPANGQRKDEFRTCWFSPALNQFTLNNPFRSGMKGGILCDEMGLGKTAATLTLHLVNPPKTPSEGVPLDEKEWGTISGPQATGLVCAGSSTSPTEAPGSVVSKGTLVVCPVSLVGQWTEEAKRLCGGALKIYPYHGGNRRKDPRFLAKFDVVVTTYGVVQVLDESHTIANTTKAATVVKQLIANRRWCMTGTPYISRFSDVNGQLKFIGLEGAFRACDLGYLGANEHSKAETLALLRRVLLRHSQGMTQHPRPSYRYPRAGYIPAEEYFKDTLRPPDFSYGTPPLHIVKELTLPPKEREAYDAFEKAVQQDYIAVRYRLLYERGSHFMAVITLLSKFRQACSGGQLLVQQSGGSGEGDSIASCLDAFCPMCRELLDSPVRTTCGHVFCELCITSALTEASDEKGPCPKCKKAVGLHDLAAIGKGGGSSSSSTGAGGSGGSGFEAELEPQEDWEDAYSDFDDPGGKGFGGKDSGEKQQSQSGGSESGPPGVLMETKLKALVGKLSAIHAEDPTSKSLVFSQFSSSLEWLKHALPKHGFGFRTLTGSMSRKQRTDALKAFANDPPTTVFLLSVRAGAVGINLTQANNVFFLEPLLNLALEKQAIGRVCRLGQSRPVTVTKLVLKDSIETRILAMQKREARAGPESSSSKAGSGSSSSSSSSGVAGSITADDAKNLKIEEYNALFGLSKAQCQTPKPKSGRRMRKW